MNPEITQDEGLEPLVELGLGFWKAKAVMAAVDLGVFAALARGPRSGAALASELALAGRGAYDFFDALVALGLLERHDKTYSNTPLADRYLDPAKATYVGGWLELGSTRLYPVWSQLESALRSGEPKNEAKDVPDYYGNLGQNSDRLAVFLRGMTGLSAAAGRAIARKLPWADFRTFVDVGGAEGAVSVQLALAFPHLSGGTFELPVVEPYHDAYVRSFGLGDRLRFHGGDFFHDPLPSADVILMGHVLHNWGLEQKRTLLRKAYEALPPRGMLVIHESLIDDDRRSNALGLLMSLNMLLVTREGFGFTGAECQDWLRATGFSETRVEHLVGAESMVIGIK
ncbi:MAG TPA: methyltransferase [Polyangiaceae bacterium]|nr:methyltransferase [Polyangiaceae bacterium]